MPIVTIKKRGKLLCIPTLETVSHEEGRCDVKMTSCPAVLVSLFKREDRDLYQQGKGQFGRKRSDVLFAVGNRY